MTAMTADTQIMPRPEECALGYVRTSSKRQFRRHSPAIQRAALTDLARREGLTLLGIEEDAERGHKLARDGYNRVVARVRRGEAAHVLVYVFSRWGRGGLEYLIRLDELDRLGAALISVQQGRDVRGVMRFLHAGMSEQASIDLARQTRPARIRAAKRGTHTGSTPFGYLRVYPERTAHVGGRGRVSGPPEPGALVSGADEHGERADMEEERTQAGALVPDPAAAWVVADLYRRYDEGNTSTRELALWMNTDPRVPPPTRGAPAWSAGVVAAMLRRPTYRGAVRHGHQPSGHYERGTPEEEVVVEDAHPALVSPEVWERVRRRLDEAGQRTSANRTRPRLSGDDRGDHDPRDDREEGGHAAARVSLATGLLRCAGCGARLTVVQGRHYTCTGRRGGRACQERGVSAVAVHAALLVEVRRLMVRRWDDRALKEPAARGDDDGATTRRELTAALEREKRRLRVQRARLAAPDDEPTPEEREADREITAEIVARLRALESQLTAAGPAAPVFTTEALRAFHTRIARSPLAVMVEALNRRGDVEALRALVLGLVVEARVATRSTANRARWVRLDVTWAPEIAALLATVPPLVTLAPQPEPPDWRAAFLERRRINDRRRRALKRQVADRAVE